MARRSRANTALDGKLELNATVAMARADASTSPRISGVIMPPRRALRPRRGCLRAPPSGRHRAGGCVSGPITRTSAARRVAAPPSAPPAAPPDLNPGRRRPDARLLPLPFGRFHPGTIVARAALAAAREAARLRGGLERRTMPWWRRLFEAG